MRTKLEAPGITRRDLLRAALGAAAFAGIAQFTGRDAMADIDSATAGARSRIAVLNGCPTLLVDDVPLLIAGSQIDGRSVYHNDDCITFFDGLAEMNATVIGISIPWDSVEVAEGRYDFSTVDWFIRQAEQRGLKVIFNLANTNICGKVQEGSDARAIYHYVPAYIRSAPDDYQRVVFSPGLTPQGGAPPMCPNDPRTLERERLYVERLAKYLQSRDTHATVVMLQLENSANYTAWEAPGPNRPADERCRCRYCDAKWASATYANGQAFMTRSFADYVEVLAKAVTDSHPLPVFVNNWSAEAARIILDAAPHISLVSGHLLDPHEPNGISTLSVGRNMLFASEAWTHMPSVRFYLDALPFYTLAARPGLGLTLWDPGGEKSIVYDGDLVSRLSDALYPVKNAQCLIAAHRGTSRLAAWSVLRDQTWQVASPMNVVENGNTRTVRNETIEVALGDAVLRISGSATGYAVRPTAGELFLCLSSGHVVVRGKPVASAARGSFEGNRWIAGSPISFVKQGDGYVIDTQSPAVIRIVLS
ncbi:MAG: hypothetical protein P4L33_07960 [Capsulimonadaceae bacterium]|nr:hypothetical protein [Capsulimonadaceae bacterium]